MFCPNCGTKVEEGRFCTVCGEALPAQDESEVSAWEPTQSATAVVESQEAQIPLMVTPETQPQAQAQPQEQTQVLEQVLVQPQPQEQPQPQTQLQQPLVQEQVQVQPLVQAQPQPQPQTQLQQQGQSLVQEQPQPQAQPQLQPQPQYYAAAQQTPQQAMPTQVAPQAAPQAYGAQQPIPAPIALEPAEASKPKPSAARIALISAAGVVVLIIAILGISALVRANKYNTAVKNYESGEDIYVRANTIADFESAYELYDLAHTAFVELDQYKESVTYAQRTENKLHLCQQHIDYLTAMQLFESGDFGTAMRIFEQLGSFMDSATMVEVCQMSIDLEEALALYEAGDLEASRVILSTLKGKGFEEAIEWYNKVSYELAERYLSNGDKYGAFSIFRSIQGYSDAEDRAWQCTDPYPGTGVLYQNDSYRSSAVRLTFDGGRLSVPVYIKLYRDGNLVASIFINAGGSATINLSPGSYRIHEAAGVIWFGEDIMFGGDGHYTAMIFDNGAAETYLSSNYIYTITLNASEGNVGSESLSPDNF